MKINTKITKRCRLFFWAFIAILGMGIAPQALAVQASGSLPMFPSDVSLEVDVAFFVEITVDNSSTNTPEPRTDVDATLGGTTVVTLACANSDCSIELGGTLEFDPVGPNGCADFTPGVQGCAVDGSNSNKVIITLTPDTIPIPAGGGSPVATLRLIPKIPVFDPIDGRFFMRADAGSDDITACQDSDPEGDCTTGGAQGSTDLKFPGVCEVELIKCVRVNVDGSSPNNWDEEICFGKDDLIDVAALGLVGKEVEWVMKASNKGDLILDECTISDPTLGLDTSIPALAIGGESSMWTVIEAGSCDAEDRIDNTATVSCNFCGGIDFTAEPITDSDDASLDCVDCQPQLEKKVTCSAGDPVNTTLAGNWKDDCTGWQETDEVAYRLTYSNPDGPFAVDAVWCYVSDEKVGISKGNITLTAGGEPTVLYSELEACTDPGVNTASISCLCSTQTGDIIRDPLLASPPYFGTLHTPDGIGIPVPNDCKVGASDTADLRCQAVGLAVEKVCYERGTEGAADNENIVDVLLTNTGMSINDDITPAKLTNCILTDDLITDTIGDPLMSISVENFPPVSVQKFPHGLAG